MEILEVLRSSPPLFIGTCLCLGLLVGSFLNVVIHRLPRMMEHEWKRDFHDMLANLARNNANLNQAWQAVTARLRGEPDKQQILRAVDEIFAQDSLLATDRDYEAGLLIGRKENTAPAYNLVHPRSACPHCGHAISALENIPVVSWLMLRGRCKGCKAPISGRYPLVELLTGLLSAGVAVRFGYGPAALGALVFCWIMVAATFIDFDTHLLPDDLTLPLLWLGLLFNLFHVYTDLPHAVAGAMLGYLSLWSVYWLFKLIRGKEGMGYGDFKLLAAIGAWLGWTILPLVILLSAIVGLAIQLPLMLMRRQDMGQRFGYGPYLAIAGIVALFWGHEINAMYLGIGR